ncbi:cupin domain-containing protein [Phenylobacterium sp.]|uniref:cupin domain-containing protein n=1 Tax=Phenylobacterium sp. TaxID=1871053 RepID=UPI002FCAE7EC
MADGRIVRRGEGDSYGQSSPWLFKQGSLTGGRFDFLVGEIAYLSGPPLHVHRDQDDTFYVVEGILTVQVGEDVIDLAAGDFASVPLGVPHTFDNIYPDQPAVRVCNLMTPGGLDELFRDQALSLGKLPDHLREKHGVTVVGPSLGAKLGLTGASERGDA